MTGKIYHPENKHPAEYEVDLNPTAGQGQNHGEMPQPGKPDHPTARDLKEIHLKFAEYSDDELDRIPIVPIGTRLEQGATYIDLQDDQPFEFTASAEEIAGENNWYVPKARVDYVLWNRLIGEERPPTKPR